MFNATGLLINESFETERLTSSELDLILSGGWRHFGTYFFRYNLGIYRNEIRRVLPLRIRLADFTFSKSQRRNLLRNRDLKVVRSNLLVTNGSLELFADHKLRFTEHPPDKLTDFIPMNALESPSQTEQFSIYYDDKLIAESYFDLGEKSMSGIYAMFERSHASRGLGIFTILCEIEYAIENNMEFYYLGYAYDGRSFYDYKKRFRATEVFDWDGNWLEFNG